MLLVLACHDASATKPMKAGKGKGTQSPSTEKPKGPISEEDPADLSKRPPGELGEIMFKMLDSNKDDIITRAEVDAFQASMPPTDQPGSMPPAQMFELMDGDKDGRVTKEEATQVFDHIAKTMASPSAASGGPAAKPGKAPQASNIEASKYYSKFSGEKEPSAPPPEQIQATESGLHVFKMLDADGDGMLSRKEVDAFARKAVPDSDEAPKRFYKLLDVNGDGKVDKDEAVETLSHIAARHELGGSNKGLPEVPKASEIDRIRREMLREQMGSKDWDPTELQDLLSHEGGREELENLLGEWSSSDRKHHAEL